MKKINHGVLILTALFHFALSPVLHAQSAAAAAESDAPPLWGTWYSLQHPEWPPLPDNLFDLPFYSPSDSVYVIDDRSVDYDALQKEAAERAEAEGMTGGKGGGNGPMSASYSSNDLWLEITAVTNDLAFLTLHNTVTNQPYALLTKSDHMVLLDSRVRCDQCCGNRNGGVGHKRADEFVCLGSYLYLFQFSG